MPKNSHIQHMAKALVVAATSSCEESKCTECGAVGNVTQITVGTDGNEKFSINVWCECGDAWSTELPE